MKKDPAHIVNMINRKAQQNCDNAMKMRFQLRLLLHVRNSSSSPHACAMPQCDIIRAIYRHMEKCADHICPAPGCQISRKLLCHWDVCGKMRQFCEVCTPLRSTELKLPHLEGQPDCVTARKLIQHYKECTLLECEHCSVLIGSRIRRFGARHVVRRKIRSSALLKHSCRCQDKACRIPMCLKMKRFIAHTNVCRSQDADSLLCREMATFCINHMITCTENDCILIYDNSPREKF